MARKLSDMQFPIRNNLLIIGLLLLTACVSAQSQHVDEMTSNGAISDDPDASMEIKATEPSSTPDLAEPEHIVVSEPSSTPQPIPTETPTIFLTATPSVISQVGSPLDGFELGELPAILYEGIRHGSQISDRGHYGVDFLYYNLEGKGQSILGIPIRASFSGKVVSVVEYYADTDLGYPYGNMVIIETHLNEFDPLLLAPVDPPEDGSLYVLYAHMIEKPNVEMGDYVLAGQVLGNVGNTGDSDAPHLHWEMRFGPSNAVFGYMTYYNTRATEAQMEAYERWRMNGEFVYFDPMLLIPEKPEE